MSDPTKRQKEEADWPEKARREREEERARRKEAIRRGIERQRAVDERAFQTRLDARRKGIERQRAVDARARRIMEDAGGKSSVTGAFFKGINPFDDEEPPDAMTAEGTVFGDLSQMGGFKGYLANAAADGAEALFGSDRLAVTWGDKNAPVGKQTGVIVSQFGQMAATGLALALAKTGAMGVKLVGAVRPLRNMMASVPGVSREFATGFISSAAMGAGGYARQKGLEDPVGLATAALGGAAGGAFNPTGIGGVLGATAVDTITGAAEVARVEPELAMRAVTGDMKKGDVETLGIQLGMAAIPSLTGNVIAFGAHSMDAAARAQYEKMEGERIVSEVERIAALEEGDILEGSLPPEVRSSLAKAVVAAKAADDVEGEARNATGADLTVAPDPDSLPDEVHRGTAASGDVDPEMERALQLAGMEIDPESPLVRYLEAGDEIETEAKSLARESEGDSADDPFAPFEERVARFYKPAYDDLLQEARAALGDPEYVPPTGSKAEVLLEKLAASRAKHMAREHYRRGLEFQGAHRGVQAILDRISTERRLKNNPAMTPEVEDIVRSFFRLFPDSDAIFGDVGLTMRGEGDVPDGSDRVSSVGHFDYRDRMVNVFVDVIEKSAGNSPQVAAQSIVHELWHAASRFIPEKTLARLKEQYVREREEYLRGNPDIAVAWQRATAHRLATQGVPEHLRAGIDPTPEDFLAVGVRPTPEMYAMMNLDEWFVSKMMDRTAAEIHARNEASRAGVPDPDPSSARVFAHFKKILIAAWNALKSSMTTRPIADQIFADFLSGTLRAKRADQSLRRTSVRATTMAGDVDRQIESVFTSFRRNVLSVGDAEDVLNRAGEAQLPAFKKLAWLEVYKKLPPEKRALFTDPTKRDKPEDMGSFGKGDARKLKLHPEIRSEWERTTASLMAADRKAALEGDGNSLHSQQAVAIQESIERSNAPLLVLDAVYNRLVEQGEIPADATLGDVIDKLVNSIKVADIKNALLRATDNRITPAKGDKTFKSRTRADMQPGGLPPVVPLEQRTYLAGLYDEARSARRDLFKAARAVGGDPTDSAARRKLPESEREAVAKRAKALIEAERRYSAANKALARETDKVVATVADHIWRELKAFEPLKAERAKFLHDAAASALFDFYSMDARERLRPAVLEIMKKFAAARGIQEDMPDDESLWAFWNIVSGLASGGKTPTEETRIAAKLFTDYFVALPDGVSMRFDNPMGEWGSRFGRITGYLYGNQTDSMRDRTFAKLHVRMGKIAEMLSSDRSVELLAEDDTAFARSLFTLPKDDGEGNVSQHFISGKTVEGASQRRAILEKIAVLFGEKNKIERPEGASDAEYAALVVAAFKSQGGGDGGRAFKSPQKLYVTYTLEPGMDGRGPAQNFLFSFDEKAWSADKVLAGRQDVVRARTGIDEETGLATPAYPGAKPSIGEQRQGKISTSYGVSQLEKVMAVFDYFLLGPDQMALPADERRLTSSYSAAEHKEAFEKAMSFLMKPQSPEDLIKVFGADHMAARAEHEYLQIPHGTMREDGSPLYTRKGKEGVEPDPDRGASFVRSVEQSAAKYPAILERADGRPVVHGPKTPGLMALGDNAKFGSYIGNRVGSRVTGDPEGGIPADGPGGWNSSTKDMWWQRMVSRFFGGYDMVAAPSAEQKAAAATLKRKGATAEERAAASAIMSEYAKSQRRINDVPFGYGNDQRLLRVVMDMAMQKVADRWNMDAGLAVGDPGYANLAKVQSWLWDMEKVLYTILGSKGGRAAFLSDGIALANRDVSMGLSILEARTAGDMETAAARRRDYEQMRLGEKIDDDDDVDRMPLLPQLEDGRKSLVPLLPDAAHQKRFDESNVEVLRKPPLMERAAKALTRVVRAARSPFVLMDELDSRATIYVGEVLRQMRSRVEQAPMERVAQSYAREVIEPMGEDMVAYDVFRQAVFVRDALFDIESQKRRGSLHPVGRHGMSEQQLLEMQDRIKSLLRGQAVTGNDGKSYQLTPEQARMVRKSLIARRKLFNGIARRAVVAGVLRQDQIANIDYFHHDVLRRIEEEEAMLASMTRVKRTFSKVTKGRQFTARDINTNVADVDVMALYLLERDIQMANVVQQIRGNTDVNIYEEVASAYNGARETLKGQIARQKAVLRSLQKQYLKAPTPALRRQIDSARKVLGDYEYKLKTITIKNFIPEGYVLADLGRSRSQSPFRHTSQVEWLLVTQIEPAIMDQLLRLAGGAGSFSELQAQLPNLPTESQALLGLIKDGKKPVVIRSDIAAQLRDAQSHGVTGKRGEIMTMMANVTSFVKRQLLYSPENLVRYTFNNFVGDTLAVFTFEPKILFGYKDANGVSRKPIADAWTDIRRWLTTGEMSDRMLRMLDMGVINASLTRTELEGAGAVRRMDNAMAMFFKPESRRTARDRGASKFVRALKELGPDFNEIREMLMRMAAYQYYEDNPQALGATPRRKIEGLSPEWQAARKARDLLIDYGNMNVLTRSLRDTGVVPFASWLVGNVQRYKNGFEANFRYGGLGDKLWVVVGSLALPFLVGVYYSLTGQDENLTQYDRRRGAIPIARVSGDQQLFLRMLTAEQDIAEWLGVYDWPEIYDHANSGRYKQAIKSLMDAPISKIYNSFNPLYKMPVERLSGTTRFPSFFKPRPISTPLADDIAQMLGFRDLLYRRVADLLWDVPRKDEGVGMLALKLLTPMRTIDPGEVAMSDAYGVISRWYERKGIGRPVSPVRDDVTMLARRYRYAVRVGDMEAAAGTLRRLDEAVRADPAIEFAARPRTALERAQAAVDRAHPLASIPEAHIRSIVAEATPQERAKMLQAYSHYLRTYDPSDAEKAKVVRIMSALQTGVLPEKRESVGGGVFRLSKPPKPPRVPRFN